jgi:hypothetical protein
MKKVYLLSVLFFCFFNGFSQTPITLTFQAKDSLTQASLALDNVLIIQKDGTCLAVLQTEPGYCS